MLQQEYQKVLSKAQEEATKDEEVIQDLKCQNEDLLCQMAQKSGEVGELKDLMKDMKELVSKLTSTETEINERCYCYCWTHGRTGMSGHSSQTCNKPAKITSKLLLFLTARVVAQGTVNERYEQTWVIALNIINI